MTPIDIPHLQALIFKHESRRLQGQLGHTYLKESDVLLRMTEVV